VIATEPLSNPANSTPVANSYIAEIACCIVATDLEKQGKMGKKRCIENQYQ
jgi:hypothetical protein